MDIPVRRARYRKASIRNNYPPSALKNLQIHVGKKPGSPFVPASSSSNLSHKRSGSLRRVPVPLVTDEDESEDGELSTTHLAPCLTWLTVIVFLRS